MIRQPDNRSFDLCFVGWGAIAQRAGRLLIERNPEKINIAAVAVRNLLMTRPTLPKSAFLLSRPDDLAKVDVDLVIEAAGRHSVADWANAAMMSGADFLISSTSAFCDDSLLTRLQALGRRNGRKIFVPPGALGGIDALSAAALTQLSQVSHTITKPPAAWQSTAAENLLDLESLNSAETFFRGTAREVAEKFPRNANVAVISAIAGIGLDKTRVSLIADPAATRNTHRLCAEGAFGRMEMCLENAALKDNPGSSEMTALNIVRSVEKNFQTLVC